MIMRLLVGVVHVGMHAYECRGGEKLLPWKYLDVETVYLLFKVLWCSMSYAFCGRMCIHHQIAVNGTHAHVTGPALIH